MLSHLSRNTTGRSHVLRRYMSVITLSDEQAIEKFRMINAKSVLYFTATVSTLYVFHYVCIIQ
jgi:hypothetical protein